MERGRASSSSSPAPYSFSTAVTAASSSTLNPYAQDYVPRTHAPPPAIPPPQVLSGRQEPTTYSHLISIPLAANPTQRQDLVRKLGDFKSTIIDRHSAKDSRIDDSIFVEPETLHLTFLMLKLPDIDSITRASDLLQSISSRVNEALGNRPISVKLTGLACLMGTQAQAQVIYAQVPKSDDYDRLIEARDVMVKAFKQRFVTSAKDRFELHATMMNVRFRTRAYPYIDGSNKAKDDWFDARDLLKTYEKEEWGEYHIPEVHLSRRIGRHGFENTRGYIYYPCCSSISLPAARGGETI